MNQSNAEKGIAYHSAQCRFPQEKARTCPTDWPCSAQVLHRRATADSVAVVEVVLVAAVVVAGVSEAAVVALVVEVVAAAAGLEAVVTGAGTAS